MTSLPIPRGLEHFYVVVSPTARTGPPIPARGYASQAGRIDVPARVMANTRPGAGAALVLEGPPSPPKTIIYVPGECRVSSERDAVVEISRALRRGKGECSTLVEAGVQELALALRRLGYRLVLLKEDAPILEEYGGSTAFFMGAHVDIPRGEERALARIAEARSIGPLSYHTDHVVSFLEWARVECVG